MPQYLTPARYRTTGSGVNLSTVTDGVLASHIASASALVNAYCCVPAGHDFRGGTITGEQHVWDIGNPKRVPSNRVWPFHRPLKTATALTIEITNNQHINFLDPNSLYVERNEGWVEPVNLALTTYGVFGYGILPNIGLRQPIARIDYTYGYDFYAEDEIVSASGVLLQADNQFFTDDNIVLVKNGTTVAANTYTVDRTEGEVTLQTPTVPTDEYVLKYHYKLPPAIARATAMLATDLLAAARIVSVGLGGLQSIKVEEVELRQNPKTGFLNTGVDGVAASLLAPYVVRSMA